MAFDRAFTQAEDRQLPWTWCRPPVAMRLIAGFALLVVAGVTSGAILAASTPASLPAAGGEWLAGAGMSPRAALIDPAEGSLDARVTAAATGAASPTVLAVARVLAGFAKIYIAIPLLLVVGATVWWRTGRRSALLVPGLAVSGGLGLSLIVKLLVTRPRPPVEVAAVQALGPSYPSGHAIRAVAVYGAFAWLAAATTRSRPRRTWVWSAAALLVAAVGAARVFEGAHWLTDILASYLLGAGWLAVIVLASGPGGLLRPGDPGAGAVRPQA